MDIILNLRRRSWLLISILLGLLFAHTLGETFTTSLVGKQHSVSQRWFESYLELSDSNIKAITDIEIEPSGVDQIDIVTFMSKAQEGPGYIQRTFLAPRPYTPLRPLEGLPSATLPSVFEFLGERSKKHSELTPHRRILTRHQLQKIGVIVLSVLVVGLAWPSVLRKYWHAPAATSDFRIDLSSAPSEKKPPPQNDLEDGELLQLNAHLEASIGNVACDSGGNSDKDSVVPVSLQQAELDAVPAMPSSPKSYTGEYYPVERSKPHAFSLLELLVVIAIVGLLLTLLLPAVGRSRMRAQTLRCATQLRQIGIALNAYANTNGGYLRAYSGWHTWPTGLAGDTAGPAWTIELMPFLGAPDSAVYNCPSFPTSQRCRNYFLEMQWAAANKASSMKLSDIKVSSKYILSGDKTQPRLYVAPFGTSAEPFDDADPDDTDGSVLAWPWNGGFYMHLGGNNVLFGDFHVELLPRTDPDYATYDPLH